DRGVGLAARGGLGLAVLRALGGLARGGLLGLAVGVLLGLAARLLLGGPGGGRLGLAAQALLLHVLPGGTAGADHVAERLGDDGARADRVVVARDDVLDAVRVAVGVDQAD